MLIDEDYRVELLKKLPVYHRKIYEYQQITQALTPELEALLVAVNYVLDSWYINTADEKGLSRLEKIAKVTPNIGDSLDTRRFKLLIKMTEKIPYTDETLEERLAALCGGEENYTIVKDYLHYHLYINTTLGVAGAFDLVIEALLVILPDNIVLELTNTLKAELCNLTYIGGVCNTAFSYVITHDVSFSDSLNMELVNGVGLSEGYTHLVTHDLSISDSSTLNLNAGVGVGTGNTATVTHDIKKENNINGKSTVGIPVNTATVITIN